MGEQLVQFLKMEHTMAQPRCRQVQEQLTLRKALQLAAPSQVEVLEVAQLPEAFCEWRGLGRMQGLIRLTVEEAEALETLPTSICKLAQLQELDLSNSQQLESLPQGE